MAADPHNKEGRKCSRCDRVFTKSDIVLTITKKQGRYHIPELVCRICHHRHYEQGE